MNNRIICIGNRLIESDCAGIRVYDRLCIKHLPEHIELIEGGIAGLNLLGFLENATTVVFVDAVAGYVTPGEIVLLNEMEIQEALHNPHYNHAAGVAYLVTVLPKVCVEALPHHIFLVGLEGQCGDDAVDRAADLAISTCEKFVDLKLK